MPKEKNINEIDTKAIHDFYEKIQDIWIDSEKWYMHSKKIIESFILRNTKYLTGDILNAGSGGSTYGLINDSITHLDIVGNKISQFKNHVIASIENMPFECGHFNSCICVGSVINYCDAIRAISEVSRVLKKNSFLILEFESSYGYEHKFTSAYKKNVCTVIDSKIENSDSNNALRQWVYSPKYVKALLESENFKIVLSDRFHIASSLKYARTADQAMSTNYVKFDKILKFLWPFKRHASNEIYLCKKS